MQDEKQSTSPASSSDVALEEAKSNGEKGQGQAKANVHDTDSVPNGGLKAWLQVAGAFFLSFNTWYVSDHCLV